MAFSWRTSTSMPRRDRNVTSEPPGLAASREEATVASLVTAPGRSAIASIMVRGPKTLDAVARLCRVPASRLASHAPEARLWLGHWNGPDGEPIVVRVGDGSNVEIHCHGGAVPPRKILDDLSAAGIATVAWQKLHTS